MTLTASKLRQEVYKILDDVIRTGKPAVIERNGHILKIVTEKTTYSKLKRLKPKKISDIDTSVFEHIDWSSEWNPK